MEVKIVKNDLVIRHRLRGETYKVSSGENFKTVTIFKKSQVVSGWTSKAQGPNQHVVFIDYDCIAKSVVLEELGALSVKLGMPFYLFQSKDVNMDKGDEVGGFHSVCLAKMSLRKVYELLLYETSADPKFVDMFRRTPFRAYVLRNTGKIRKGKMDGYPKFLSVIGVVKSLWVISTAHKVFLEKLYPEMPKIKYSREDHSSEIKIDMYETGA